MFASGFHPWLENVACLSSLLGCKTTDSNLQKETSKLNNGHVWQVITTMYASASYIMTKPQYVDIGVRGGRVGGEALTDKRRTSGTLLRFSP